MNKTAFVILRVNPELKSKIEKKAKSIKKTVSRLIRDIIEANI